ncbi:MAG: hypothetical protein H7255_18335 [Ramlibacter sp.]|nr:hypothetical protein [Ramlibacter sp.]
MYQRLPSWVLGFHGTDEATVKRVLNSARRDLRPSLNNYDWLGDGIYFWENDPARALSFIHEKMSRLGDKRKPAVIGAVIDFGLCMNLVDQASIQELSAAYKDLKSDYATVGLALPENKGRTDDLLFRHLDKAVFDQVHELRELGELPPYQTVRSPFLEGEPLYPNTFFHAKTHIQIAVRDPACIKGYFLPRGALSIAKI